MSPQNACVPAAPDFVLLFEITRVTRDSRSSPRLPRKQRAGCHPPHQILAINAYSAVKYGYRLRYGSPTPTFLPGLQRGRWDTPQARRRRTPHRRASQLALGQERQERRLRKPMTALRQTPMILRRLSRSLMRRNPLVSSRRQGRQALQCVSAHGDRKANTMSGRGCGRRGISWCALALGTHRRPGPPRPRPSTRRSCGPAPR